MANSSSTVVVDSSTTTNAAIPLAYGWVWATGKRHQYYMMQNTGSSSLDYTRIGIWLLGEGEWDGCKELWINDDLIWTSEWDDTSQFHFHRGSHTAIGTGLSPYSSGPDQGVDSFFSSFPSAIQPLPFSGVAYYGIKRKQAIKNQINTHQNDATQWTDIAPIGLFRSMRTRIFDADGNTTGYAFTTNPAWQLVDVILRREVYPEYNIDFTNGIDDIISAARKRFDWEPICEAAAYFDEFLSNGRRRSAGNFCFSSQTTLAAIVEVMLRNCRSFIRDYAGKISIICDKPRSSVFMVSREHVMPGSLAPSDKTVSAAANKYVGKFRDLLVPVAATIASITCSDHKNPIVTTTSPHPFNANDRIHIGGRKDIYDGKWTVASVPSGDSVTALTLASKGLNYPAEAGAGGSIGVLYSRFKERAPTFNHEQHQKARGMVGLGLPRLPNQVPVEYDFNVSTFDQVSRICRYERDRTLGPDVSPYVTPRALTLTLPIFARDASGTGRCALQVQAGDRITVDDKASFMYAGDYEVLEPVVVRPLSASASGGDGVELSADASSGEIEWTLGPYSEDAFSDVTDPLSAGWSNVPDSDPGNDGDYTAIDLADGGSLAFVSGSLPSGSTFELPSTGFNSANLLGWASPQGYIERWHVMHVIQDCKVDSNRVVTLNYVDGDYNIWHGDVNFAALTWSGSAAEISKSIVGAFTFVVATLAGGEKICFGYGQVASGAVIQMPDGFTTDKMFARAFPQNGYSWSAGDHQAHGVGAYVDDSFAAQCNYQDGEGHVWHGNPSVLIFGWQNNAGTVVTEDISGSKWVKIPTSTGYTLGVGVATLTHGASMSFPTEAASLDSLQSIATPRTFEIVGHPAHGVAACYMDANGSVVLSFEDGEGHVWHGTADIFALFYEPTGSTAASAGGIVVALTPYGAKLAVSGTQQFSASIAGSNNADVTWSVDGVDGGSSEVGTIDATGLYTAPATDGSHTVRAISQANSAAWASLAVTVGTGSGSSGSSAASIVVAPKAVRLTLDGTNQFSVIVSGSTDTAVVWYVAGDAGGNSDVGIIDETGFYTAPATSGAYLITAKLASDLSVAGSAYAYVAVSSGSPVRIGTPVGPSPA